MNILIVVDMQNDFVSGALGTPEARRIVPAAAERVAAGIRRGERIFFTRDTHGADYLHTREGRNLPVPHCIRGTEGWEIVEQLRPASAGQAILDKPSFGSAELGHLRDFQRLAGEGVPAGGRGSGGCRLLRRCHPGEPSDRACGHEELPDHRGT